MQIQLDIYFERLMNEEQGRNTSNVKQKFEKDHGRSSRSEVKLAGPDHSMP